MIALISMMIVCIILYIIYNCLFFNIIATSTYCICNKKIILISTSIFNTAIIVLPTFFLPYYLVAIIMAVPIFIEIIVFFRPISIVNAFFCSATFCFFPFAFQCLFQGIYILLSSQNDRVLFSNMVMLFILQSIMFAILNTIFIILTKFEIAKKLKTLYLYPSHFRFISTCSIVSSILLYGFMIFISSNLVLHYDNILPVSIFYIAISITLSFLFFILMRFAFKGSALLKYEIENEQLQKQMEQQLNHYRSYLKYTDSIKEFKVDYVKMMQRVYDSMQNGDYFSAKLEIDRINDEMSKKIIVHKKYSNSSIVDAIMQDFSNICTEHNIQFNATIYLPEINLSDLMLCFYTSTFYQDIFDIVQSSNVENPFIEVETTTRDNWIIIKIQHSYTNNLPLPNTVEIEEVLANAGAFIRIDKNEASQSCTFYIHLKNNQGKKPIAHEK